jgi:hypothetical protein
MYAYIHIPPPVRRVMAHHKTISLDEHTAKIADRMPNFSRFVRQCLLKHARSATEGMPLVEQENHIAPESARIWGETKDKCNPNHRKGTCPACWGVEE